MIELVGAILLLSIPVSFVISVLATIRFLKNREREHQLMEVRGAEERRMQLETERIKAETDQLEVRLKLAARGLPDEITYEE